MLFRVERNKDFAIGGGNGGNVALCNRRPAIGDADIVDQHLQLLRRNDRADLTLQRGETQFGLFDSRSGGTARMETHLAGIDFWKEILADQSRQAERCDSNRYACEAQQHFSRDAPATSSADPCSGSAVSSKSALKR